MAYSQRVKKSSTVQTYSKEDILDVLDKFGGDKDLISTDDSGNNEKLFDTKFVDDHEESLQEEWDQLFQDGFLAKLKAAALNGNLGTQHFRSICWRVFWRCLPENPVHWVKEVKEQRNMYTSIRNKYVINPYEQEKELDLEKHHPLSQSEDSVWHKYFQDNELRSLIIIDLDRLSPELEFFQNDNIRSMILHILFCYAREKPKVSYKQGMHEIVSVIIYVIMKNTTAVKDSNEVLSNELKTIMDVQFVEHDSYMLFAKIMEPIQSWFTNVPQPQSLKQVPADQRIFKNTENEIVTAISEKLNRIQGSMLKIYDNPLCLHLQKIDISPQLYGIRWMRLLFGREFPLNKLLILWDALFAYGLDLVDYVFLAMLINLRAVLLQNDFNKCLSYLMKYPANTDSKYILKQALLLKNYSQRKVSNDQTTTKHPQQHKVHPVRNRLGKTKEQLFSQPINSGGQIEKTEELVDKKYFGENLEPSSSPLFNENRADASVRVDASVRFASQLSQLKTKVNSIQNPLKGMGTSKQTKEIVEDKENLQEQIYDMQTEFYKLQSLCCYCGDKMDSYINLLQHRLLKEEMFNDEIAILSIAGLKQIREIFKGGVDLNFLDHEVDFKDIDSHIASASDNKNFAAAIDPLNTDNSLNGTNLLLIEKISREDKYQGKKTANTSCSIIPGNLNV